MTPRITDELMKDSGKVSYHVYIFTDEESCAAATTKHIPDNCWCRVVLARDAADAITVALNCMNISHQIYLSDGELLNVAVVPSLNLGDSEFKKYDVHVTIEPTYVIGERS